MKTLWALCFFLSSFSGLALADTMTATPTMASTPTLTPTPAPTEIPPCPFKTLRKYMAGEKDNDPQSLNSDSVEILGNTSWRSFRVSCTSQPCVIQIYNASVSATLFYVIDSSLSDPLSTGTPITVTFSMNPVTLKVTRGNILHFRFSDKTGDGYYQECYK